MIPHNHIIDPWSTQFVDDLVRRFRDEVKLLLRERGMRRAHPLGPVRAHLDMPGHHEMRDPTWRVRAVPADLLDRRVEITGPAVDPRMAAKALNSGAQGYMVDGEDSLSPTWEGVLRTQSTLTGIVRRSLHTAPGCEDLTLVDRPAVLHFRPRGLHLTEKHWLVDGAPAPAALVDAGLFLFHNAVELLARRGAPYLYLAKLETEWEARLWHRVLEWCEDRLGLPDGRIRVTVLVETLPGLIRADSIVWALRDRLTALNVGRWDWIFSAVKCHARDPRWILPNRAAVGMDTGALSEYARWVVHAAHARGAHAIGGMAAQVPNRRDPVATLEAAAAVRRDKVREFALGHDGTWVAHPDLVPTALAAWRDTVGAAHNQLSALPGASHLDTTRVVTPPPGPRTREGLREAVRAVLRYASAWLSGNGCVALDGRMEDAATAEICRALLWQWVARGAELDDGTRVTVDLFDAVVRGETEALVAAGWTPRQDAVDFLTRGVISPNLSEFMVADMYEVLE